jgi:hypothetical protein
MKIYLPFLLLLVPGALWAQSGELWIDAGASILATNGLGSPSPVGSSNDDRLGDGFRIGLRFDYNSAGRFGHELQYAYNHADVNDTTGLLIPPGKSTAGGINQFGYNLLYYFNAKTDEAKIRPFVTVGLHLNDYVLPYTAINRDNGDSFRPGFNYGGGMKFRLSPMFGWRFDVRAYDAMKPNWSGLLYKQGGLLQQYEVSAGFGFYF